MNNEKDKTKTEESEASHSQSLLYSRLSMATIILHWIVGREC